MFIKISRSKRFYSTANEIKILTASFPTDSYTNVTPKIISLLNRNLYKNKDNPICLIKDRIIAFFFKRFVNSRGNPLFSVYEDLSPIVTVEQNFDSLLVPKNHASRAKTDCYYINEKTMLRAHMTAHQSELIKMGLNNFLMVGDVYRRDAIKKTHYPVFHQLDAVRLITPEELFAEKDDGLVTPDIKCNGCMERTKDTQEVYSIEASQMVEKELKTMLEDLSRDLFGSSVQYKWVDANFPFTHPSWELEIMLNNSWVEMLGCGIVEHEILQKAGCSNRIGWACGMGLERLGMLLYSIPDIRLFWSNDSGFVHQFKGKSSTDKITYKPFSIYPACPYDISFWISENFNENDFYDMVRSKYDDIVEQIYMTDRYEDKKTGRVSCCFRISYRSMEKTLKKEEVNVIHKEIEEEAAKRFNVIIR